jgi:soluble lytic murein transglycosylase
MNQRFGPLICVFSLAMLAALPSDAWAHARHKQVDHDKKADAAGKSGPHRETAHKKDKSDKKEKHAARSARHKSEPHVKADEAAETPPLSGDLAAVKNAIELVRKGKTSDATAAGKAIGDPAAQKLVEWFILKHPDGAANFARYDSFITDNPGWPSMGQLRRRAEACLWQERSDAATVHRFTGDRPASAKGSFALARALLAEGDRDGATRLVREAWRSEELAERIEGEAFDTFRDLLTRDDHRARMDKRIGAKDFAGAMRAARRLGDDDVAIVKACAAVNGNETKARDLLDGVASAARQDLGYTLCRIHSLARQDKIDEATRLMLAAPTETMALQDTDEWWRERRMLARKLLDLGEYQNAYQVVRNAALPVNEYYQADFHFMTGWIALRYLNDLKTARASFAHIDDRSPNPIVIARAHYWRGRAAEAARDNEKMRAEYEAAARHGTAYYGQLARAKLSLDKIELRTPPPPTQDSGAVLSDERVRAADMLYTLRERDVVKGFASDLADQSNDAAVLAALGELTAQRSDAPAMLEIGKTALGHGLAMDIYAFPAIGIPEHSPVGPKLERSIIYSVARTESAFDQRDKSSANAVGLMQVTPEAGRDTAKRFGVTYDWDRMVSDPVYNTQMGAAEISALWKEYNGSQIMTFAGYNAGRGRVREWVKQHGDPRDPKVDPVDWVERIPISETRNYVQRVMENLQVYRARFGTDAPVTAKAEQQDGARREANSAPAPSSQASDPE